MHTHTHTHTHTHRHLRTQVLCTHTSKCCTHPHTQVCTTEDKNRFAEMIVFGIREAERVDMVTW